MEGASGRFLGRHIFVRRKSNYLTGAGVFHKGWPCIMESHIISGYISLRKQKLILVRDVDLITASNSVAP